MAGAEVAFFFLAVFLASAYFLLLISILNAFFAKRASAQCTHVLSTLVLPFKNEARHLPALKKHYHGCPHEVCFVNDHSTDLSHSQLEHFFRGTDIALLALPAGKAGKKAAIHYGVMQARNPWIFTTDADTRIDRDWLDQMKLPVKALAIVLPIAPARGGSLWNHIFALEFIALQMAGCASAKMHRPLLANGAAFLYQKAAYQKALDVRTDWQQSSGDDVFTLHAIASQGGEVDALTHAGPVAQATFPETLRALWKQRLRWVGKAGQVTSLWYRWVSWLVLLTNLSFVFSIWQLSQGSGSKWIAVVAIKIVADICLLAGGVLYFRRRDLMRYILPAIAVYPFYLLVLVTTTLWHRPQWK